MDIDIQLQVTDKELEEFPEEYPTNDTTNSPTDQCDTHSPARQFLVLGKETLIQLSIPLTYGKQTLIQLSAPSTPSVTLPKQSLVQPRVPLLLTLQPQPDLPALVRSLTPQGTKIHTHWCSPWPPSKPAWPTLPILQ